METFRFFHISDLHFSKKYESWKNAFSCIDMDLKSRTLSILFSGTKSLYPSTYSQNVAISAYQYISQRADQADAVIVTGDLATTGTDEDLTTALNYFKGIEGVVWNPKAATVKSLIDSDLHIIMMPGNHDRYHGGVKWMSPGNKSFEEHFEDNWCLSSKQKGLNVRLVDGSEAVKLIEFKKNEENVLLYCIDFSLRRASDCEDNKVKGFFGQGYAYKDIIDAVKADMKKQDSDDKLIVWAVHFAPESDDEMLKLYNADALLEAACEKNVSIIMCGHVHSQKDYMVNKNGKSVNILCAGTVCSAETDDKNGNSFWDVEFDVDAGKIVEIRKQELKFDQDLGFC